MRYAIYFMPSPLTDTWRFGSSVIGYDAFAQRAVPFPVHPIFSGQEPPPWSAEPRRYGFHATLKAPFALAEGVRETELHDLARAFAEQRSSFVVPDVRVRAMGRFVALMPAAPVPELDKLARDCVMHFEPLRAPSSEANIKRRWASSLTERQVTHLERWGYPYVMEKFRFHMTLAGPLEPDSLKSVQAALEGMWAQIASPMLVDAITIAAQPSRDARFIAQACYKFALPAL